MANQPANDPFAKYFEPQSAPPSPANDPFAKYFEPVKKKDDTVSSGGISSTVGISKPKQNIENPFDSFSFIDAMTYNRNAPEKNDYTGLSSVLSAPKLLASGGLKVLGNAFGGAFSFLAKTFDDVKAAGTQAAIGLATGNIGSQLNESAHKEALKIVRANEPVEKSRILGELGNKINQSAKEISISAKKDLGWKDEDMNKGFTDFVSEGNISKALGAVYAGVVENIPQMALLAATGGSSSAVFAGSTILGASGALAEEYQKDQDISYADAGISLVKGMIEGATETIFKTDLDAARSLGKSVFKLEKSEALDAVKKLIKEEGVDGAKEAIMRDAKGVLKKTLLGGGEEGLEEVLSTVGNFIVDTARSGEWNQVDYNKLLKQGIDSFVIGFASGGAMSGLAATAAYRPLEKEQQIKVDKFMEVANDESLSKEVRDIAKKQADDILKYDADKYIATYNQLAALPIQSRIEASKIMSDIQSLESDKKDVKDLDVINQIDEKIKSKNQEVQQIFDNHKLNLADQLINDNQVIDGNVAFSAGSQLNVLPDQNYTFHFDSKNQIPEPLRAVEPQESGKVEGREKAVFRATYSGQDLINAGLATQAQEVTNEQVSDATKDVQATADSVQQIINNSPQALESVTSQFQEQDGKTIAQQIAEEYHAAKENGTNQELVDNVDNAIRETMAQPALAATPVVTAKPKRKRNVQTLRGMKPTEGVELSENMQNDFTGVLGKLSRGTKTVLQNYVKALKSVRPEAKVFYYENEAAMEKGLRNSGFSPSAAKQKAATSGGLFTTINQGNEVVIHINRQADLSRSGADAGQQSNIVLAHEIVHATLLELARTNPSEFKSMRDQLLGMLEKDEAANQEVLDFVARYKGQSEEIQAEEFLAQLGALITRQKATLNRSTLQKVKLFIREFLQKVASKFRSKALMDLVDSEVFAETADAESLAQFLEGLGKSLREGKDIDMKYIKNKVKGSPAYQNGLRMSVLEQTSPIPQEFDANTLMNNDMNSEPEDIKQSVSEGNWLDNAENKKRMSKYVANIKGMTNEDVWLAKAISMNENKGNKIHTLKDKESVLAALENQLMSIENDVSNQVVGQYDFAKYGELYETGGYLFTGWKPEYIAKKIDYFTNEDWNPNEVLRWTKIRDDENYHKQEVGVVRDIQQKALLGNIREFVGHNEFDPAFSYLLLNSMIYNKYQVVNAETGEFSVFKYKQNQLASTDASFTTLQYDVVKKMYDEAKSQGSAQDVGMLYQTTYMNMPKFDVKNSKFSKYIDKESSTKEGYWLKFPQGDNPEIAYDLFDIAKTSHKYPAKWCTGGSDSMAAGQLRSGDFYVFVDNKTGDARIAVRYQGDKIGEIRGLGEGQAILADDAGIIEEVASTFKDGKSYESYSKTLNDIKNISKNALSKESAEKLKTEKFHLLNYGEGDMLVEYFAQNHTLEDFIRIISEEDRSYGSGDILLDNIQNNLKYFKDDILLSLGESQYAIVDKFSSIAPDADRAASEVKYVLGDVQINGAGFVDFPNLIKVGGNIQTIESVITANKLVSVKNLRIIDGGFSSKSLQSIRNFSISGSEPSVDLPNLKEIVSSFNLDITSNYINLPSLETIGNNFNLFFEEEGDLEFSLPSLTEIGGRIDIRPATDTVQINSFNLNLPFVKYIGGIRFEDDSIYHSNSYNISINTNNERDVRIDYIIHDSGTIKDFSLILNGNSFSIEDIKSSGYSIGSNSSLSINPKDVSSIKEVRVTGTTLNLENVLQIDKLSVREGVVNSTDSIMRVNSLRISKSADLSNFNVDTIKYLDIKTCDDVKLKADFIEQANIDYSNAVIDAPQIISLTASGESNVSTNSSVINEISLNYLSKLTAKEVTRTSSIFIQHSSTIDAPKVEDLTVLSVNEYGIGSSLIGLKKIINLYVQNSYLKLDNLKEVYSMRFGSSSTLVAEKLKRNDNISVFNDGNDGYFDANGERVELESKVTIIDSEGKRELNSETSPNEPSDVKESLFGDIGKPAREEYKRRTNKNWKQKFAEVYNKIFERNEEARKEFKESNMTFSLYNMYLKAGATPFAMKKFADYYKKIYDKLDDKQKANLDSVIFLKRVIAIDTNFDNRGKKRPSHPDIPLDGGKYQATNKETAQAELDKYKQAWGDKYFADLERRADEYFNAFSELLKYRLDNDLITQETYDLYKDYNYEPRKFIENIIDANGIPVGVFVRRGIALSSEDIKNIQKGSTDLMLLESDKLLKTAMISTEHRVMTNRALKVIFEEGMTRNNPIVRDANYVKLKDGTIKLEKDGTPVVKEADNGFVNKTYRDKGKVYTFQMRRDISQQFDDTDLDSGRTWYQKLGQWLSGAPILQRAAVTLNPFFGLVNPIVDLGTQIMFSNTYKAAGRGLIAQSIAATKEFVNITRGIIEMDARGGFNLSESARSGEIKQLMDEYGYYGGFMTTMSEAGEKSNMVSKGLSYYGNVTEIASKLAAYKFIKESMLADFAKENVDPVTGDSIPPTEQQLSDILTSAAYHARATLDYNRGGKWAKENSYYVPFLNVSLQVKKIGGQYIVNNPTDFTRKMMDGIFITAAITLSNLLISSGDYEKDKKIKKSKSDKTIIMFPFTLKDLGLSDSDERAYLAIPTPSFAKVFFNIGQIMAEELYYKSYGKENPNKESSVYRAIKTNYEMLAKEMRGILLPKTAEALIEYVSNYDFWTGDKLTHDDKLVASQQGSRNEEIMSSLKLLAQTMDKLTDKDGVGYGGGMFTFSPEKFQKASENITSSPVYNGLVNTAYWMIDNTFQALHKVVTGRDINEKEASRFNKQSLLDNVANTFGKGFGRLIKVTEPDKYNMPDFDAQDDARQDINLMDERIATGKAMVYKDLLEFYKQSKDQKDDSAFMKQKAEEYVNNIKDKRTFEYASNVSKMFYGKTKVDLVANSDKYYNITSAENKAYAIWRTFGDIRGNQQIIHDLNMLGIGSNIAKEYMQILKDRDVISKGDENNPVYEDWYKSMIKKMPETSKTTPAPPTSSAGFPVNDLSVKTVAGTIGASLSVATAVTDIFNKFGDGITGARNTVVDKLNAIKSAVENNPTFQDAKSIVSNPDLILAAIQREIDKRDESNVVSKRIVTPKPAAATPAEFSLTGGKPVVSADTTTLDKLRGSNSDYMAVSSIVDLNKVNVGERNRGDYKEGQGNLIANVLSPFVKPENLDKSGMYVGIKNGKIVSGNADNVKDADVVTKTPFAQVKNITNELVKNQSYLFPKLETVSPNQESILNISATKSGSENVNNKFAGGATILETPDGKSRYLVRGSLEQVRSAFNDLKKNTNSPYLNMYILDNGSYSTGLFTKDNKSSVEELKAYESKNVNGGHGIFLK